jgi:hypothetical protein
MEQLMECISEKQLSKLLNIKEATLRTWRARAEALDILKQREKKEVFDTRWKKYKNGIDYRKIGENIKIL